MEAMPMQKVVKKKEVYSPEKMKKAALSRRETRVPVYPPTSSFDWSVNILFRAESDLHT